MNNSIWPIDRTLTSTTNPGQSDLVAIAIKGHSTFPKTCLELHYQMVCSQIQDTRWSGVLTPPRKYSRRILQPLPSGLVWSIKLLLFEFAFNDKSDIYEVAILIYILAQSAGVSKYTDCTSAKR